VFAGLSEILFPSDNRFREALSRASVNSKNRQHQGKG
jgi:hypothetical protein